jgi:hypothetical protein
MKCRRLRCRVPILHVVSDRDHVAPPAENTDVFAARYREQGGPIDVYRSTGAPDGLNGHHFPLDDPDRVVNFVLAHAPGMERAAGTGLTPHGVNTSSCAADCATPASCYAFSTLCRSARVGWDASCIWRWVQANAPELNKRFRPQSEADQQELSDRRDIYISSFCFWLNASRNCFHGIRNATHNAYLHGE